MSVSAILRDAARRIGDPAFSAPRVSLHPYFAVAIAMIVAAAYICLVVTIDNTNLGTTNGLWKSPEVFSWGHEHDGPLDSGGILYAPVYGLLTRLVPAAVVSYGTPAADLTFRKMAILNALFGGLASGLVFILALRFTTSPYLAVIVSLIHAGAAFVLLNSINSEDIIPAYVFFLGAAVGFFEYLHRGGIRLHAASAVSLAFAALFHWTAMVPALAAIGAVYVLLLLRRPDFFQVGAIWLLLFVVCAQAAILVAFPHRLIPAWAVLLPEKADASGWVGLFHEKGWNLLVGIGNYFAGGSNTGDYKSAFANASLFHRMLLSWAVLAIAMTASIVALVRGPITSALSLFAAFGLVLFVAGEIGAVYSQPQDPQMQIVPMFATIIGMIVLLSWSARLTKSLWRSGLAAMLALAGTMNGAWNVQLMREGSGQDSRAISAIAEMDRLFPRQTTAIVWQGFEGWTTWQYVLLWPNDSKDFFKGNVHLTRAFTMNQGISGQHAAAITGERIDAALASGKQVVAASFWTQPDADTAGAFTTVTTEAEARTYIALLKDRYRTGKRWVTQMGPFVELLPAGAGSGGPRP